jgi:outer membrane protein assembly factor BamD (BamD/ComL family)
MRAAAFYEASNGYYERAAKHPAARADAARHEVILFESGLNALELRDGKKAATSLERCLERFPKSDRRADVLVALGQAYTLDEKKDKARQSFNSVIADHPGSPAATRARMLLGSL